MLQECRCQPNLLARLLSNHFPCRIAVSMVYFLRLPDKVHPHLQQPHCQAVRTAPDGRQILSPKLPIFPCIVRSSDVTHAAVFRRQIVARNPNNQWQMNIDVAKWHLLCKFLSPAGRTELNLVAIVWTGLPQKGSGSPKSQHHQFTPATQINIRRTPSKYGYWVQRL